MTGVTSTRMNKPLRKLIAGFVMTLVFSASAGPGVAQPAGKIPQIGFLGNSSPTRDANRIKAFRNGLRELGYVEGKDILIEFRYAGGKLDRLPDLAAELVRMKVAVIVARGTVAARAARKATTTIPIVMAMVGDPVRSKIVKSLARPGGNVTGLTPLVPDILEKLLELLKEIDPKLSRVAYLYVPKTGSMYTKLVKKKVQNAGKSLGIRIQPLPAKSPEEIESAFEEMRKKRAEAVMVSPFFVGGLGQGQRIADLAVKNRLPAISSPAKFVNNGGLIAYGADVLDLTRRAAHFVDKILKGAKPANLPVEQPTKFSLVINQKTAKALGITIPPSILLRATELIE